MASGDNINNLRIENKIQQLQYLRKESCLTEAEEIIMSQQIQSKKIQSTSTSIKNVQNKNVQNNSQKLFLAKCLVEQQLEQTTRNTQLSIKMNDETVLFKTRAKKIAAVSQNGNLYIFAKPVESFKGLPLDSTMIPLNRIEKIDGVMRCVKCREWVTKENISQCPCGGYLKARKRFQMMGQVTESLDTEYLEVQAALEDMRISARIDCRPKVKIPVVTGIITPKMAGMSSVSPDDDTSTESVGFLTAVHVKSNGTTLRDEEKYQYFKELGVDVESIQNREIQELVRLGIRERAKIAVAKWDSGNDTIPRDTKHTIREKRKQHHNTAPKPRNSSMPTRVRSTHSSNKPANGTTCNSCLKKVAALVGPTCQDCFLRDGNLN